MATNCICSLEMSHRVKQQITQWAERTQDVVAMIKLCARHHIEFWCWDISALVAPYLAPPLSVTLTSLRPPPRHMPTGNNNNNNNTKQDWSLHMKEGRPLSRQARCGASEIDSECVVLFRTAACFHHLSVSACWFFDSSGFEQRDEFGKRWRVEQHNSFLLLPTEETNIGFCLFSHDPNKERCVRDVNVRSTECVCLPDSLGVFRDAWNTYIWHLDSITREERLNT